MKIVETIKVPAKVVKTPAKAKKITRVTCDVCLNSVDLSLDNRYGSGMSKCDVCNRDICRSGKNGKDWPKTCWVEHPEDSGDYPRKMCIICKPFWSELYKPMQERHYAEEKAMERRVKKESLSRGNEK